jgi:hypothetical protein
MMKRIAVFITMLTAPALSLSAQDAAAIMERAKNQSDAAAMSSRSRMVITAKNGSITERVIDQYSK